MSSANHLSVYILFTLMPLIYGQECSNGLTSPPNLEWTSSPTSPDILRTTLTFDVSTKTWNNDAISFTTRLYNGLLPAPTMRIQRGRTYEIVLLNNLGPERAENALLSGNQERDPNTTNLHTHGLHISPLSPADEVLTEVVPGGTRTYTYRIPCNHSGGVHWYHPHHHPSVQLQVAGGAAGAIIVEDAAIAEGLPDWYTEMRELVFFINHIDSTFIRQGYPTRTTAQEANQQILQLTPRFEDVYLVNGKYQPTVCQSNGEWIKFRFLQTEIRDPQKYQIGDDGECTLKLLTRDGVIINNPPRDVGNMVWLAESSRADVAITCNAGLHAITVLRPAGDLRIAYIHVDPSSNIQTSLTSFDPIRAPYLRDLRSDTVDNSLQMEIRFNGVIIDGGSLDEFDANSPFFDGVNPIAINSVNEWRLVRDIFGVHHPFHIHVNHFQVVSGRRVSEPIPPFQSHFEPLTGWQEPGDYLDTIWGASTIRFMPDIWGGPLVLHCHRLEHEVGGAMGAVFVYNGCDSNYNDYDSVSGSCNVDPDACFTSNPTTQPTYFPTMIPTDFPTFEPTNVPTTTPTKQPSVNPTQIPTEQPTIIPTNTPTTVPTKYPSTNPTKIPTGQPTMIPTNNPTNLPTTTPTKEPSPYPTRIPTISPTVRPTTIPTNVPTMSPSKKPSPYPTRIPTISPTVRPTTIPTNVPTMSPTVNPTNAPTWQPTTFPTISPTQHPSSNPTPMPTITPTERPTIIPTNFPTIPPTKQPTKIPTNKATVNATNLPTTKPGKQPSSNQTRIPSSNPTTIKPIEYPTEDPHITSTVHWEHTTDKDEQESDTWETIKIWINDNSVATVVVLLVIIIIILMIGVCCLTKLSKNPNKAAHEEGSGGTKTATGYQRVKRTATSDVETSVEMEQQ